MLQGLAADKAMLRGEAIVERGSGSSGSGAEECLVRLSAADLPSDPGARFARLFALRPRWELPELEPYLADLQVHPSTPELSGLCHC